MAFMYCPNCKGLTEMKAVGASKQPKREKRLYFKRERKCQSCSTIIATVEVRKGLIAELDELKVICKAIYKLSKSNDSPLARKFRVKELEQEKFGMTSASEKIISGPNR